MSNSNTQTTKPDAHKGGAASFRLSAGEQQQLLVVARQALIQYFNPLPNAAKVMESQRRGSQTDTAGYSDLLRQPGCAFVSLHRRSDHALRGCIGSLTAYRPLYEDVAANSVAAATADPRFSPLSLAELGDIYIEVSVLSPQTLMHVESENDLLRQLKPSIDGLTIDDGQHRATFLPLVWSQLPDPKDFLQHLKVKAGMRLGGWSPGVQCYRYHAENFSEVH